MSGKQNNLTDKEIEDLQNITTDTLASICTMADKHNIDRNSMLKYFADMLTAFAEVASIQNYKFNRTNADRIRNMSDEELLDFICSIQTYEEGSVKTIENVVSMHTVTEVMDWLQSEAE